jgi:NADH-quinone oxidoreductase subunit M
MVAYSSISHMGVVVLGIATLNVSGLLGATTQMVAHGLSAGALFLMVGLLYERTHSREVTTYAALVKVMPGFTIVMTIALLASIGMPGSAGFVAELHTLVGGFERWGWPIGLVSAGVLVGAAYAVRTVGHLFTGPARAELTGLRDLQGHEIAAALPLALGLVVLGLQPALMTRLLEATITALAAAF